MDNKLFARASVPISAVLFFAAYFALGIHSEYWLGVVTTHPIGDDFKIYYGAYLKAKAGENPYEPYGIGSGFIYHPSALTFVSLFSWLGNQWLSTYVWMVASVAAWGASIWLALRLARAAWGDEHTTTAESRSRIWFVAAIFLGFAPFWETIHIGQNNAFVLLCLLTALYLVQDDKQVAAGVALALAIVLKTSPLILLAYFGVTRKFRLIASTFVSLLVLSGVAVAQFSPQVFNQFWAILPRLGSEIHPDTYNQSILSVLYQSLPFLSQNNLEASLVLWHKAALAVVCGLLLASGLLMRSEFQHLNIWLFMALLTAIVFFSPLVWYHHSTFLLLPLTALLLHPHRSGFLIGLGSVFVLQAERLFEQFVTLTAYPVVAIQTLVIVTLSVIYFNRG